MKRFLLAVFLGVVPVRAGTVAHYRFERTTLNAPLYELTDASGNGHHGRVLGQELFELSTNVPPYPGVSGEALDLRGRLDYGVIPHHSDFAPGGDWTIEFFIKVGFAHQEEGGVTNIAPGSFYSSVNTNLAYTVLAKQNTNEPTRFGSAWAFHYVPTIGSLVFTISFGADRGDMKIVSGDLRDGEWHHIAVVFAASEEYELRVFQDGFQWQSHNLGNVPFSWGDGPIWVGAWARQDATHSVDDRNFDGMLDEIRFSDAALDANSFVVDFGPFLYPPIQSEAFQAIELQFQAEAGVNYRVEQIDAETGLWVPIGYAHGEGGLKSFFHRRDYFAPPIYRVVRDTASATEPISFTMFEAIELRFPTDRGQLYLIKRCETLNCLDAEEIYLLGDGAKMSYFERALPSQSRFYKIDRY
jgi:hypothetical protein